MKNSNETSPIPTWPASQRVGRETPRQQAGGATPADFHALGGSRHEDAQPDGESPADRAQAAERRQSVVQARHSI